MYDKPLSDNFMIGRRRFGGLGEHYIQVCVGFVEELFEIEVIHQNNSHDCGETGEAPSPF